MEKCALLEKDYDEQIDDASLNDNQGVIETLPHVIANMPQSLVNDIMNEQIFLMKVVIALNRIRITLDAIN